jgi:hypothetical protein
MARLRYRWLLPLGHALVDVIVISHLIWQGYQWQRQLCRQPPVVRTETPPSEGAERWDPRTLWDGRPRDLDFLLVGTIPAGLISYAARPEAGLQNCSRWWDPVWFSIYESIALLFWFLLGGWLDRPGAPLRKLLGVYLGLRLAFALFCWLVGMPSLGPGVETLFWIVLCYRALDRGCSCLHRRLHARP